MIAIVDIHKPQDLKANSIDVQSRLQCFSPHEIHKYFCYYYMLKQTDFPLESSNKYNKICEGMIKALRSVERSQSLVSQTDKISVVFSDNAKSVLGTLATQSLQRGWGCGPTRDPGTARLEAFIKWPGPRSAHRARMICAIAHRTTPFLILVVSERAFRCIRQI